MIIKNNDIYKIENIPLEQRIQYHSTYDLIAKAATQYSDKIALYFLPEGKPLQHTPSITYKQLLFSINQTANLFTQQFGLQNNQVISLILPNIFENYFVLWAAEATAIANPIAAMLPPEQIAQLLIQANTDLLITLGEKLNPFWQNVLLARDIFQKQTNRTLKLLVIHGQADETKQFYDFNSLIAQQPGDRLLAQRSINKNDVCAYFHTSGTTGPAKLAKLTHWGKLYMAWAFSHVYNFSEKDVILAGLPMFHVAAPTVAGNAAFMCGASVVIMSPIGWMEPNVTEYFWQTVAAYKGTVTAAMPFSYTALLDLPIHNADISSLRLAVSGTALPPGQLARFEKRTKAKISEIYGLTESTCLAAFNPIEASRVGSMGMHFPYERMRVIHFDHRGNYVRDCLPGEPGVLFIKGPNVAHYQLSEVDKKSFLEGEWLNTGDIVKEDQDGYFWMVCRSTDVIYRNHNLISSLDIEKIILTHPQVVNAAVLAQPDDKEGEVPVAFIVTKANVAIDEKEMMHWLQQQIKETAYQPAAINFVKQLPVNGMGKVLKFLLNQPMIKNSQQVA